MEFNDISGRIIGCAIEVHKQLGPGMLESAYEECLVYELIEQGFQVSRQLPIPVIYKKIKLNCGYRLDLLVSNQIIVEIKAVDYITAVHSAQLLTYMRFAEIKTGLLINFNVTSLSRSIRRLVL
jgi:GxxExxY protein